jgi:outer membrane protein TolC
MAAKVPRWPTCFTGSAGIWTAAIGLSMVIFDAGKTEARVDQASAGAGGKPGQLPQDTANGLP